MNTTHTPLTDNTLVITLPPGNYTFSDPCYCLDYGTYDDIWSPHNYAPGIIRDERGDLIMAVDHTRFGDGCYSTYVTSNTHSLERDLVVDSGTFAVLNADNPDVTPAGIPFVLNEPAVFTAYRGTFRIDSPAFSLYVNTEDQF